MTSSLRFGTRIKDLSVGSAQPTPERQLCSSRGNVGSPDDAYNLQGLSEKSFGNYSGVQWPTEDRAFALLETFLGALSTVQQLLDARAFTDQLSSHFRSGDFNGPVRSLWDIEYLLVMAIGELLQGSTSTNGPLPGVYFYKHAMAHLPQLGTLRSAGVIAVEIVSLSAFYLQCADCKEDAYVYVS